MIKQCKLCGKDFRTYPSKVLIGRGVYCSKQCSRVTLIKKGQRISPATEIKKGQRLALGIERTDAKEIAKRYPRRVNSGSFKKGERKGRRTEFKKGTPIHLHPRWLGGRSFEPYPLGWNKTFKEQIRYRDGYICHICGMPEIEHGRKLSVHHINYDKKDISANNLISLCTNCHCKTNTNRKYWLKYFKEVMSNVHKGNKTASKSVAASQGSANRSV